MGKRTFKGLATVTLIVGLSACASTGGWRQGAQDVEACLADYADIDRAVKKAGVRDVEYARIKGFPYFRIDRFLASYDFKSFEPAERTAWVDRLAARDLDGRRVELGNLPPDARSALESRIGADPLQRVETCSTTLRAYDHDQKAAHRALPSNADVDDSYSSGWRLAGLYPLTALAVNFGFSQWKANYLDVFDTPPEALPVTGRVVTYTPESAATLSPDQIAALIDGSRKNALAIPEPKGEAADALISHFAPAWRIDVASEDDFIGTPAWRGEENFVNAGQPRTYVRFSHVHWRGQILLQINYLVWFPARPLQGGFDVLGGHIDGVTWRVTIGPDGRPLLYDSMHNCGCYHLFFPGPRLQLKRSKKASPYYEGTVVAAPAPRLGGGQRIVIRLASISHYLEHVGVWDGRSDTSYPFADYHDLRRLPAEGRTRSLYGENGIVKGTQRTERYWLWTMGIASPGAMRQWGHHATAFVGRRHFDDPWLIEKTFEQSTGVGE